MLEDHGAEETVLFVTGQPLPQPIAVEVYDRMGRLLDQQPWSVSFPTGSLQQALSNRDKEQAWSFSHAAQSSKRS